MKTFKIGLLPKIIIAIVCGVVLGFCRFVGFVSV